jgi:hypothetical protein
MHRHCTRVSDHVLSSFQPLASHVIVRLMHILR